MLKHKDDTTIELPLQEFKEYNESIFYDENITPDTFTPLENAQAHHITPDELTTVLQHHFKANKSSGLSQMPLRLLKHMGPPGVQCLTSFLNSSAID
jgi:hypothetical protein